MKNKNGLIGELAKNKALYLMMIPGLLLVIIFSYIPMLGITVAFRDGRTVSGYFTGKWVGFDNFKFFFASQDAATITFNTVYMNFWFMVTGTVGAIICALLLNELKSRRLVKTYQTIMFMPYFLSWVIMGFVSYAFLSVDSGYINSTLKMLGMKPVEWYGNPDYWPPILIIVNLIKNMGYNTVVYFAAILGIDESLYEAAEIDGANKLRKIIHITLPLLTPLISILTLLQIGRIFNADFGLFYYIPRETGILFPKTDVINTYVYRALRKLGDVGMSSAIGLFQSVVGFVLVLASNYAAKKINPDNALF